MPRRPKSLDGLDLSDPARMVFSQMRLTEGERAKLQAMAARQRVTLSWAMYEGARLYLEDLERAAESAGERGVGNR